MESSRNPLNLQIPKFVKSSKKQFYVFQIEDDGSISVKTKQNKKKSFHLITRSILLSGKSASTTAIIPEKERFFF